MEGEIREVIAHTTSDGKLVWTDGDLLAVRGWAGCKSLTCTRRGIGTNESVCIGWHCPRCGSPCDSQGGHRCTADSDPLNQEDHGGD